MDQLDGDYLGSYRRFLVDFVQRMNPDDQLPVKLTSYDVREAEVVGEVIDMTLQYLNQKYCPPSLQSHIVHLVIEEIKTMCRKQPEACGLRPQEKTYAPLKLMQAVTGKVNEICQRYLDNSRLALLPPPPSTPLPLATVYAIRNSRRKMEDRHVILHDLNSIFNIQDESTASYYAVFDGHVGPEAAVYCAAHLHQYLVESDHYPTDPERALRDAFITTDAHFVQKSSDHRINSGATAVCALIINRKLYVAWAGDSQAALAKRDDVTQLVNPHRPDRIDEKDRVINMGGNVVYFGMWRVNGHLAVSRAIGDAQYKPYVTGDPEIRCVQLDGTEDFLIVACDGLWDYIDENTAAEVVYQQICCDPYTLEAVSQRLVEYSKSKGSSDNITVIVVFLTPPSQIVARLSHSHPQLADVKLNNMEPDNRYFSGQYDVNASFVKQLRPNQNNGLDEDESFAYGKSANSNGQHENGAVEYDEEEEDEEDNEDLGPESNVDAVDDAGTLDSVSRELFPEKSPVDVEITGDPNPKQNELTADAENVGESEDSDDEWNYYRVDPEKTEAVGTTETSEINQQLIGDQNTVESLEVNSSEKDRDTEREVANSSDSEDSEREVQTRQQLTETEIREKTETEEPPASSEFCENPNEEMDFQLNPNAAEFIPVSPAPTLPTRILDIPIAGSPLKQTPVMDDIRVPSPTEFQEEVSHRPSEIEDKIVSPPNGDLLGDVEESERKPAVGLDESEVSSTRAEFGDESTVSFLTAGDFRAGGLDGSFTSSCAFDNDPMTISFGPGEFNPLGNAVDLNAVHDLTNADLLADSVDQEQNDVHQELVDLISPESDQPKPSEAFPDQQMGDVFDDVAPLEQDIEERIAQVSQSVEAMNLKNQSHEEPEPAEQFQQESPEIPVNVTETFDLMSCDVGQNPFVSSPVDEHEEPTEDLLVSPVGERGQVQLAQPMSPDVFEETRSPATLEADLMETPEKSENTDASIKLSESLQEFTGLEQQLTPVEPAGAVESVTPEPTLEPTLEPIEALPAVVVPEITKSVLDVAESVPEITESVPEVTEVAPQVAEAVPQVTEVVAQLADIVPEVTESIPQVAEAVPQITEAIPQIVEAVPQITEAVPQITEAVPQVTEPVSQIIEPVPQVTEAAPYLKVEPVELKVEEPAQKVEPIPSPEPTPAAEKEKEKPSVKSKVSPKPPAPKTATKTLKPELKSTVKASPSPNKAASPRTSVPPTKALSARPKITLTATKTTAPKPPPKAAAPRVAPIPPKPKPTTASSRLSATKSSVDKKPSPGAINGDVKSATTKPKPAASRPLVKSTVPPATRPATAPSKTKTLPAKPPAATSSTAPKPQRPKTAPPTGAGFTAKPRTTTTAKSPALDKQIKESANKQISSSRTAALTTVKKTERLTTTSTAPPKPPTSKTTLRPGAARVPKTAPAAKATTKTTTKTKLQNGEAKIETAETNGEDVPQKDVSPVEPPSDNQLIITAE